MTERKLVTLKKITSIESIEGADFIELCKVDGWQCIAKKGEFKVGHYGMYFEVDSFLPIEPRYEFLRKACYKKMFDGTEGFRLKTIRLKGQLSQGLLLPLNTFGALEELDDYTEVLGVRLFEKPIHPSLAGVAKGNFPVHIIPKTNQDRVQNLTKFFKEGYQLGLYKNIPFEVTEKLDGMSITIYQNDDHFGVCSRNLELEDNENSAPFKIVERFNLKEKLTKLGRNLAIQGELVGPGIQNNPLKLEAVEFYVFDIYDINTQKHLTIVERMKLVEELKMFHVPHIVTNGNPFRLSVDKILEEANKNSAFGDFKREGLVYKSSIYVDGQVLSFKAINNEYLLGEK